MLLSVSEAVPANFPFIAPWVNIPRWMPINWALANIAVKQMLGPMWWPGNVQSAKGRVGALICPFSYYSRMKIFNYLEEMSQRMTKPTIRFVRPAKTQISLHILAV